MRDRIRCTCQSCTIRHLMGPAVLITVGVLFLLQELHSGRFDFNNTWPVILVVIGAIRLASSMAPMEGHVYSSPAPVAGPPAPGASAPPSPGQGI
ncbi:MAG TPA: DUF5668 domain-containing protein [Candidatus Dormibacteraeota bacterium]|nr:DUF5668 domain-containing protein [Candidatus Dormibacteraeota bacterium]